jgi:hypothetical protein
MFVVNPEGKNHFRDVGIDGDDIEVYIEEIGYEGMDWTVPRQDRVKWRSVVKIIFFLLSCRLSAHQLQFSSVILK